MAQNRSLSTQEVAEMLHISRSTVYELIRRGEINSYKIGRKVRFTQDDVDVYIARSRHEHSTQPVERVDTHSLLLRPEPQSAPGPIISGQDVLLDILANHLHQEGHNPGRSYLSSFEGLLALYEGRVDAAACHLWAADEDEYNVPFVKRLMPGIPAALINISYRTQGFYVRRGNPKGVAGWDDLRREDVTIFNRRLGSSSRILLDGRLHAMGIDPAKLRGYERSMKSHLTMAAAVAEGEADVGLGTERVSRQIDGIDFIPLQEERYDLAVKKSFLDTPEAAAMLGVLRSGAFRREIERFSGNDYRDLGRIVAEL